MPNEHDGKGKKFLAMYRGVVVDNKDPKKMGRCRIEVPGVLPPEGGAWALPIGWPGAGSAQRGVFNPPPINSDVAVWFEQGDPEHPVYMGGNPGIEEVPPEVSDASTTPENATKVAAWETDRWRIKIDSRPGKEECHIIDKVSGDVLEIDGVNFGVRIFGTSVVEIQSLGGVNIDGANVRLGGRMLVKNGRPIN
jgi:hypothetical protein